MCWVAFLYGSLIGSFLNVLIYRLPLGRSIVFPSSACVFCGIPLRPWQNIPIVSYFWLGGRCYYCGTPYSGRYAFIEFMSACVASFSVYKFGLSLEALYYYLLFCLCTVVFFCDLDHWIIPDSVNYFGVVVGLIGSGFVMRPKDFELLSFDSELYGNVFSSVAGIICAVILFKFIQLWGYFLAHQEAMGGGDVKFSAVVGSFLGVKLAMLSFLLSFLVGVLVAVILMVGSGKGKKEPIPFGTFMAMSAVAVAMWGDSLLSYCFLLQVKLHDWLLMPLGGYGAY